MATKKKSTDTPKKSDKGKGSKGLKHPRSSVEKQTLPKSGVQVGSPSKILKKQRTEDLSTKKSGMFADEKASKLFDNLKEVNAILIFT